MRSLDPHGGSVLQQMICGLFCVLIVTCNVARCPPLRIGFGQIDYFHGKISDLRAYNRALTAAEVQRLAQGRPD